ncbi:General transcription factor II-I repeat domain-containing protein 2 [Dufourea novaeangliae]|nr:General transcription factor II-I repeat domain-containing protein 2 [Dufourea novaeangliae]
MNKILCLICKNSISVAKEYNLKRHYDTNHKTNYDQYVAKLREDKLSELKSILQKQQSVFTKCVEDNTAAVKVSYILSHLIASRSKPFTEGEFISECLIKAAEVLCPAQIKKFKSVSLSRNTVASRIDEIAENLRNQHNTTISTFQAYSIAIDESTDIRNIAQLAVFIRGCDVNLKISEELLEIIPMHNTTTGADIFDALMEVLKKYKLPLEKFVCLATDGAPTMTGITKGVVARLKETCKQHGNNNFEHFHCIIHQQVLCSKVLNIGHVLKIVTKIVNYIRARGLNHRQFASFLEDIECEYTDLPYYTEVRWLSSHKVLKRFFKLLDEIIIFLETENYECAELKDGQWIKDLAFSVDITSHLNQLNLKLQGKNHVVTTLFDNINAFKQKLLLWRKQIEKENLSHFESCQYLLIKSPKLKFTEYAHQIKLLETEFDRRFSDFKSCELQFRLFTSPLSIDIEIVDENLQMELIEIQCDSLLKQKCMEVGIPDFYTYLSVDRFPKMLSFVTRIMAMFGSTYLCEQLFSLMKNNKNSERSRLTDQHLSSILKIASAQYIQPNFDDLLCEKRCQISSQK